MTLSSTELIYIVAGLRTIQDGNFKESDKREARSIINKIQMEVKSHSARPIKVCIEPVAIAQIGGVI